MQEYMLKRAYIEITNVCNLSCSFCPESRRKLEFMEEELFLHVIGQLKGITKHLYFHVKGEPLLHPKLIKYIELSQQQGFYVNLTTNGTLIGKWHEAMLDQQGLRQVSFSLQSFEGDRAALEEYLSPIIEFTRKAILRKINVELRLWNLNTSKEIQTFNTDILERIQKEFEVKEPIVERVIPEKGIKLKEHLYLSQSTEFSWPNLESDFVGTTGTCYGLRQQVGILVDGTVIPCCLDQEAEIDLGNLRVNTMQEIMESDRVKIMVEGFKNHKISELLCQHCGYRVRFSKKVEV